MARASWAHAGLAKCVPECVSHAAHSRAPVPHGDSLRVLPVDFGVVTFPPWRGRWVRLLTRRDHDVDTPTALNWLTMSNDFADKLKGLAKLSTGCAGFW